MRGWLSTKRNGCSLPATVFVLFVYLSTLHFTRRCIHLLLNCSSSFPCLLSTPRPPSLHQLLLPSVIATGLAATPSCTSPNRSTRAGGTPAPQGSTTTTSCRGRATRVQSTALVMPTSSCASEWPLSSEDSALRGVSALPCLPSSVLPVQAACFATGNVEFLSLYLCVINTVCMPHVNNQHVLSL